MSRPDNEFQKKFREILATELFQWPGTAVKWKIADSVMGTNIFGQTGSGKSSGSGRKIAKAELQTFLELQNLIDASLAALVDSSPAALDTLNELAAALGDDPNFATTITNSIATKVNKAGDAMTGALAMGSNKITGLANATAGADAVNKTILEADKTHVKVTGITGAYTELKKKVLELGDWDMENGGASLSGTKVTHGISDWKKIRNVVVLIRNDADDHREIITQRSAALTGEALLQEITLNSSSGTKIAVTTSGNMGVDWDSTSYNRGWMTIEYEE